MFDRATITLGIGPRSSCYYFDIAHPSMWRLNASHWANTSTCKMKWNVFCRTNAILVSGQLRVSAQNKYVKFGCIILKFQFPWHLYCIFFPSSDNTAVVTDKASTCKKLAMIICKNSLLGTPTCFSSHCWLMVPKHQKSAPLLWWILLLITVCYQCAITTTTIYGHYTSQPVLPVAVSPPS